MKAIIIVSMALFSFRSFGLTDQEALELGMTPIEHMSRDKEQFKPDLESLMTKSEVLVVVDKNVRNSRNTNGQTVTVYHQGKFLKRYNASTGTEEIKETTSGRRYIATTPNGIFRPTKAYKDYMSRTFLSAPMTWAVFFTGGIALHSTTPSQYPKLGSRASGGCVRMRYDEAQELNQLIVSQGEPNFRTVDQSETVDGAFLKRVMYVNRDKFPMVNRYSGELLADDMWTYDVFIVVVGS